MTGDDGEAGRSAGDDDFRPAQDDRREVRSEAEGTVPEQQPEADDGHDDKKQGSFWKELPVLIGVALVLALLIKAFAVQAFYIPSGSMESTLQVGDRVLVNKIVYRTRDIERGEVVVFNGLDSWDPEVQYEEPGNVVSRALRGVGTAFGLVPGEKDYIKRVIGIAGDEVKCCDAQGRITVNDMPLDERSYLYTDPFTGEQNKPSNEKFEVKVPEGMVWVMGDHRDVSSDSRGHRGDPGGGSIPESRVIGRAFVIVWPVSNMGTLPAPDTFDQAFLSAPASLTPATPLALGVVGALPITWLHRRRRLRRGGTGSTRR